MTRKYSFLLFSLYLLAMPAVAYEPIPPEISSFIKNHLSDFQIHKGILGKFSSESVEFARSENFLNIGDGFLDLEPWSINIDINGDGKIDWFGYLVSKKHRGGSLEVRETALYCVCSTENSYQAFGPLREGSVGSSEYAQNSPVFGTNFSVHRAPPGNYRVQGEERIVNIENDVAVVDAFMYPTIMYWDGKAFQSLSRSGD